MAKLLDFVVTVYDMQKISCKFVVFVEEFIQWKKKIIPL